VAQSPAQPAPALVASSAPVAPSTLLKPALDNVQQTMGALKLEKWKKGDIRDGAGTNIAAIQRDIQDNLPPLLQGADTAPGTISNVLPLYRNVDALYDVVLRVLEASRVSAPADQIVQLQQALTTLGEARHALDGHLQESASALEKQVSDLRSTLKAQSAARSTAPPPPVIPKCPAPAPARKPRKKTTPPATTAKPTSPPATPNPQPLIPSP
jgi:hypothetical protein